MNSESVVARLPQIDATASIHTTNSVSKPQGCYSSPKPLGKNSLAES